MSKRNLPFEIWENIFSYTNKRLCQAFNFTRPLDQMEKDKNLYKQIWYWHKDPNIHTRLTKMIQVIPLIQQSESKKQRIQLKKHIHDLQNTTDVYYNNELKYKCQIAKIHINKLDLGCDLCKTKDTLQKCGICFHEYCQKCIQFNECNVCNFQVCLNCNTICQSCSGFTCTLCIGMCSETSRTECSNCLTTCNQCEQTFSFLQLNKCCNFYCNQCTFECFCEKMGCNECIPECSVCSTNTCLECMSLTHYNEYICNDCKKTCPLCNNIIRIDSEICYSCLLEI